MKTTTSIADDKSLTIKTEKSSSKRGFAVIRFEDRHRVRKHGGMGLQDFWLDCWEADPYGSRYVLMADADLKNTTHRKYRRQLRELNLFMFEIRREGNNHQLWLLNRRGSRSLSAISVDDTSVEDASIVSANDDQNIRRDDVNIRRDDLIVALAPRPQSEKEFQTPSISSHDLINISLRSLSISEREEIEKFVRKNWKEKILDIEVFLSKPSYFDKWYSEWLVSSERVAYICANTDWTADPDWSKWVDHMKEGIALFVAFGTCFDRPMRKAIADWAEKKNLIWGTES